MTISSPMDHSHRRPGGAESRQPRPSPHLSLEATLRQLENARCGPPSSHHVGPPRCSRDGQACALKTTAPAWLNMPDASPRSGACARRSRLRPGCARLDWGGHACRRPRPATDRFLQAFSGVAFTIRRLPRPRPSDTGLSLHTAAGSVASLASIQPLLAGTNRP